MTILSREEMPILRLEKVSKNFGGVIAAKDVDLDFFPGEIIGLIGPNGAGKTTLVNLISGIYAVDSGTIIFKGRNITKLPTHQRARLGIARTFQHPRLLSRCNIFDNIMLGADLAHKGSVGVAKDIRQEIETLMELCGMGHIPLDRMISQMPYGQQKMLEIIRAVLSRPDVLLLDEPAAGLNTGEIRYIVSLIKTAVDRNISVLLIEHSMDLVMDVCDRLTVLNFGHQIANGSPTQIQMNQVVIEAYLGSSNQC